MSFTYYTAEDLDLMVDSPSIKWDLINDKTLLVTGATGMIGSALVSALVYYKKKYNKKINIALLVRSREKAQKMFCHLDNTLHFIEWNEEPDLGIGLKIDYIIHCACITNSYDMLNKPVDVIDSIVDNTKTILEYAKQKNVKKVVYLSSMEIYGRINNDKLTSETDLGYIDLQDPRSSYPESKRLAELMCTCYSKQFGLDTSIVRLVQVIAPTLNKSDNRLPQYLIKCLINKEDIILYTDGTKQNMYIYIADAVSAIFTVLTDIEEDTFNVANEMTFCSVKEFSETVSNISGNRIKVLYNLSNADKIKMYGKNPMLKLDTRKISEKGWIPKVSLEEMIKKIASYQTNY